LQHTLSLNNTGMAQFTQAFTQLGLPWIASHGNFVSVDMGRPAMPIYEALLRKGVIVRPVANYEMPQHLRISIGTTTENQTCINALTQVLAGV